MIKTTLILALVGTLALVAGPGTDNEVVLTAADVTAAYDIENALQLATDYGARPGIVTLDASGGPFTYYEEDRSINIFYPNVTLRSLNGAVLANCADGVFFDNFPLDDVTIQGITFDCSGGGVAISPSDFPHSGLVIQDNVMDVYDYGITITGWHDVTIRANQVTVREGLDREAIYLTETSDALVLDNELSGYRGLALEGSDANQVVNNDIAASWQGVLLKSGSDGNKIIANRIRGPQAAGIALEAGTTNNKVHGNRVTCAAGYQCLTVDASPDVWRANKITGNRP
jgi:nitrous oxidase accessory protein NosD